MIGRILWTKDCSLPGFELNFMVTSSRLVNSLHSGSTQDPKDGNLVLLHTSSR